MQRSHVGLCSGLQQLLLSQQWIALPVVLNSLPIIGKIVVLNGLLVIGPRSHYLQDFLLTSGAN